MSDISLSDVSSGDLEVVAEGGGGGGKGGTKNASGVGARERAERKSKKKTRAKGRKHALPQGAAKERPRQEPSTSPKKSREQERQSEGLRSASRTLVLSSATRSVGGLGGKDRSTGGLHQGQWGGREGAAALGSDFFAGLQDASSLPASDAVAGGAIRGWGDGVSADEGPMGMSGGAGGRPGSWRAVESARHESDSDSAIFQRSISGAEPRATAVRGGLSAWPGELSEDFDEDDLDTDVYIKAAGTRSGRASSGAKMMRLDQVGQRGAAAGRQAGDRGRDVLSALDDDRQLVCVCVCMCVCLCVCA